MRAMCGPGERCCRAYRHPPEPRVRRLTASRRTVPVSFGAAIRDLPGPALLAAPADRPVPAVPRVATAGWYRRTCGTGGAHRGTPNQDAAREATAPCMRDTAGTGAAAAKSGSPHQPAGPVQLTTPCLKNAPQKLNLLAQLGHSALLGQTRTRCATLVVSRAWRRPPRVLT